MKVFCMSEYEFWCAPSLDEAVADYKLQTGEDPDPDELRELSDAELDQFKVAVCDENDAPTGATITFREELAERTETGFFAGDEG